MFVSGEARQSLLAQRRERFFEDVVDQMLAEAAKIGVPLTDIIGHIEQAKGRNDV